MKHTLRDTNKILGTSYKYWRSISGHKYLTTDFINAFKNELNWEAVSACQPIETLMNFQDKINWEKLLYWQKLPEDFIEEHLDKFSWFWISARQDLTESFIIKHKDKVDWNMIFLNQTLSKEFIKEYKNKCDSNIITNFYIDF